MKRQLFFVCLLALLSFVALCKGCATTHSDGFFTDAHRGELYLPELKSRIDDISRISVRMPLQDELLFERAGTGVWIMKSHADFPADVKNMMNFLYVLSDLRVGSTIPGYRPSDAPFFGFDPADSTRGCICLFAGDDCVSTLYCGDRIADFRLYGRARLFGAPLGRYYQSGSVSDMTASSEALNILDNGAAPWFTKLFFKVEYVSSMCLAIPQGDRAQSIWTAVRAAPDSALVLQRQYPGITDEKLRDYLALWANPQISDVMPRPAQLQRKFLFEVKTFENFTYQFYFYKEGDACYYTYDVTFTPSPPLPTFVARDAAGSFCRVPRAERALSEKFILEKYFSTWSYRIPERVYDFFTRPKMRVGEDK